MSDNDIPWPEKVKVWMQVAITLLTLPVAGFVVFFSDATPEVKEIAAGWAGLVIGFWLSG